MCFLTDAVGKEKLRAEGERVGDRRDDGADEQGGGGEWAAAAGKSAATDIMSATSR